jgi:TPR repeat protein
MDPLRTLIRVAVILTCLTGVIAPGVYVTTALADAPDFARLRKQAKDGDAEAQYQLANAYLNGTGGTTKDLRQGVDWLRKAANLEHAPAQYALWIMYRSGFPPDIPKNSKQGLAWLRRSADHGYSTAQYNLALLYHDGDAEAGVNRNFHEAAAWFRKAARQPGSTKSQAALEEMLQKKLISKQESNWRTPEATVETGKGKAAPFTLAEVETGLKGSITNKRMATLVQKFGVDFKVNAAIQKRLADDGADADLLQTISASKRS